MRSIAVIPRRRRERVKATKCEVTKRSFARKLRYAATPQRHALRFDSDALNSLTARENGLRATTWIGTDRCFN